VNRYTALLLLAAGAALLFTAAPEIDLFVSGLFYRPGEGFFLSDWGPVRWLYRAVPYITTAVILLTAGSLLLWWRRGEGLLGPRRAAYLLLSLAIGPGLLVNVALKDHWGRARPSQIVEFGGTRHFTPALVPAQECERNCSFTAGHPALGFFLVSFALLIAGKARRRQAELAALGFGALCGAARIIQGGHFFSDVVFSGLVVYGTSLLLYDLVVEGWRPKLTGKPSLLLASAASLLLITIAYAALDRPIAGFFHERPPWTEPLLKDLTRFGVSTWYLIGTAVLFLGFRVGAVWQGTLDRARQFIGWSDRALFVFASVAVPGLAVDLLKMVFGRARPKLLFLQDEYGFTWWKANADHWSFPSGHTACAVALATSLSLLWPRYRAVFGVFAVLVAASRVMLTAHYLSDVLMAAYLAVTITLFLHRRLLQR